MPTDEGGEGSGTKGKKTKAYGNEGARGQSREEKP